MSTPTHGTTRPQGVEVSTEGMTSYLQTLSQTYCGFCRQWIQTNGVLGPLKFRAFHRDGDCAKDCEEDLTSS